MAQMTAAKDGEATQSNQALDIAVFEGDGVGPEIMRPTLRVLDAATAHAGATLRYQSLPAGAAHYQASGDALPEASLDAARASDAILLAAMGMPSIRYDNGTEISPQIDLRMHLGLFAGVRPVFLRSGVGSPLKVAETAPHDFVLVRESTEGLFASHGRGEVDGDREARETLVITRSVSEKLFHFAFRLARRRKAAGLGPGRVH